MQVRTIDELVRDLRQRREVADPPPILLLGAGASIESGIGAMDDLFAFVDCKDFAAFSKYVDRLTAAERFRLLARFLQTRKPAEITEGYQALANLCAEAYFDLILTTNLDPLLDDALAAARLWRKDYLLLVNGVHRPDRLPLLLATPSPRVKVLKLHGDLFHRFMAWTPEEMVDYVDAVSEPLHAALNARDLLVVGHSLRDERIREIAERVLQGGGTVWYTNPSSVPDFLSDEPNVRAVLGESSTFERLFPALLEGLSGVPSRAAARRGGKRERQPSLDPEGVISTIDDFMATVVAVAAPGSAKAQLTGFLIRSPRLIITDRWPAEHLLAGDRIDVIIQGQRFETRAIGSFADNPFGPMMVEIPKGVQASGLPVDGTPVTTGEPISIGVAAGERVGVSSGTVLDATPSSMLIAPAGNVPNMVSLRCSTAPGASGAPVIDAEYRVRGFVTAGTRMEEPLSYMYPTAFWADRLADALPNSSGHKRTTRRSRAGKGAKKKSRRSRGSD